MKYRYINLNHVVDNVDTENLTQKCMFSYPRDLKEKLDTENIISKEIFTDEYFFFDLLYEQNTIVKKRITQNEKIPNDDNVKWIIISHNSDGTYNKQCHDACPSYLDSNAKNSIGKYFVERIWYNYNGIKIRIDKVTCKYGDMFCNVIAENISTKERDILNKVVYYPIRSNLMEFIFRYDNKLYCLYKDKYFHDLCHQICILEIQYKEMKNNGLDNYLDLIDICQGEYENLSVSGIYHSDIEEINDDECA